MCINIKDEAIIKKLLEEFARNFLPKQKKIEAFERKTIIEMHDMQKDIKNISDKIDEMNERMNTFIASADTKYASKEIEKAVKRVMWTVMLAVIVALLALVIKS